MSHDGLRRAFDARAPSYAASHWHVAYAEGLVRVAAPTPGMRVLDAACGTGFATIAAARAVGPTGQVVGVDISAGMLDRARAAEPGHGAAAIEWRLGDAADLAEVPPDSLDLVLCAAGLLYLPVHTALSRWRRLLREGGTVAFSTMRAGYPVAANLFRAHAARFGLEMTDPALPLGDEQSCRQALRRAGLHPVRVVAEQIEFSSEDLAGAWQAHVRGPHHADLASLSDAQREDFRSSYNAQIEQMLVEDPNRICTAEVLYAVGRA